MKHLIAENSLYTNDVEREEFVSDKKKVASAFWLNLFGMIGLFSFSSKRGLMKTYFQDDKQLRLSNITDENKDLSLLIKLYHDAGGINRSTVDKLTRMLVKIKQKSLTSKTFDESLFREIVAEIKYNTVRPSPILSKIINAYVAGEFSIQTAAKEMFYLTKTRKKEFLPLAQEFYTIAKQYIAVMGDIPRIGANTLNDEGAEHVDSPSAQPIEVVQPQVQTQAAISSNLTPTAVTIAPGQWLASYEDARFKSTNQYYHAPLLNNKQAAVLWAELELSKGLPGTDDVEAGIRQLELVTQSGVHVDNPFIKSVKDTGKVASAVKNSNGHWVPGVFTADGITAFDGAPSFAKLSDATSWAEYELSKGVNELRDLMLQKMQDEIPQAVIEDPIKQEAPISATDLMYLEKVKELVLLDPIEINTEADDLGKEFKQWFADGVMGVGSTTKALDDIFINAGQATVKEMLTIPAFYADDYDVEDAENAFLKRNLNTIKNSDDIRVIGLFNISKRGFIRETSWLPYLATAIMGYAKRRNFNPEIRNDFIKVIKGIDTEGKEFVRTDTFHIVIDYFSKNARAEYDKDTALFEDIWRLSVCFDVSINITYFDPEQEKGYYSYALGKMSKAFERDAIMVSFDDKFKGRTNLFFAQPTRESLIEMCKSEDPRGTGDFHTGSMYPVAGVPNSIEGYYDFFKEAFTDSSEYRKKYLRLPDLTERYNPLYKDTGSYIASAIYKLGTEDFFIDGNQRFEDKWQAGLFVSIEMSKNSDYSSPEWTTAFDLIKTGKFLHGVDRYRNSELIFNNALVDWALANDLNLYEMLLHHAASNHFNNGLNLELTHPRFIADCVKRAIWADEALRTVDVTKLTPTEVASMIDGLYYSNLILAHEPAIIENFINPIVIEAHANSDNHGVYNRIDTLIHGIMSRDGELGKIFTPGSVIIERVFSMIERDYEFDRLHLPKTLMQYLQHPDFNLDDKTEYQRTAKLIAAFSPLHDDNMDAEVSSFMRAYLPEHPELMQTGLFYLNDADFDNMYATLPHKSKNKFATNQKKDRFKNLSLSKLSRELTTPDLPIGFEIDVKTMGNIMRYNDVNVDGYFDADEPLVGGVNLPPDLIGDAFIKNDNMSQEDLDIVTGKIASFENGRHGKISLRVIDSSTVNMPIQYNGVAEKLAELKGSEWENSTMEPVWHGCGPIAANMILRKGFAIIPEGDPSHTGSMLGEGVYFTNVSDKAGQYVKSDIDNQGYNRELGTTGYFFEMYVLLGKPTIDYTEGGTHTKYDTDRSLVSPEWCAHDYKRQIIIKRVYRVVKVDSDEISHLKPAKMDESTEFEKLLRKHTMNESATEGKKQITVMLVRDYLTPEMLKKMGKNVKPMSRNAFIIYNDDIDDVMTIANISQTPLQNIDKLLSGDATVFIEKKLAEKKKRERA